MSLKIEIKISGDATVKRKLAILGDGINHMPNAMRKIGEEAADYYRSIGITDKGRPWGSGWQDLSMQYKKWKEKHYPGRPIMIASGNLENSFFAKHTDTSVTIGNSASYYKYHQSSAERKSNLPRRQMAGVNGRIKDLVKQAVRAELVKKLDGVK